MSWTVWLPGDPLPLTDADEIRARLEHAVDVVIESGPVGVEPTTVVDLTGAAPVIARQGRGDASVFA